MKNKIKTTNLLRQTDETIPSCPEIIILEFQRYCNSFLSKFSAATFSSIRKATHVSRKKVAQLQTKINGDLNNISLSPELPQGRDAGTVLAAQGQCVSILLHIIIYFTQITCCVFLFMFLFSCRCYVFSICCMLSQNGWNVLMNKTK